jgi:cystathionine beta-synthase
MVTSVLDLIGNTPIVKVSKFDTGRCELFVKLESQNPSGSIKDRIALSMIEDAERSGKVAPGGTLIEATAGNTGLGLAQVAALKGYKLILVIPDKMSQEKIRQVRALGAEVVLTRSDVGKGHPEYYQDIAERLAQETPNSFYVNQFGNPANPEAHERSTGPEMWEQMEHAIDAVVCGVGSGGTLTGLSRYFAKVSPSTEMVLADPVGSILDHYVKTGEVLKEAGSWLVEGTGEDFIPSVADLSRVKTSYSIPDSESFEVARELLRREGILAGPSTGLLVAAALRYCREQSKPKRVVTFICDSGSRYLTKLFDDTWMRDQGLISGDSYGDLRDLISQRVIISVGPDDTLTTAYTRMRAHGVSQLPVIEGGELRGIIDEWDLLHAVNRDGASFSSQVRGIMTTALDTIESSQDISTLVTLFERDLVPIIMHEGRFVGVVTKIDYLNYLRKQFVAQTAK